MSREGQGSADPATSRLDERVGGADSSGDRAEREPYAGPVDAYALAELALRHQRIEAMIERARRQLA